LIVREGKYKNYHNGSKVLWFPCAKFWLISWHASHQFFQLEFAGRPITFQTLGMRWKITQTRSIWLWNLWSIDKNKIENEQTRESQIPQSESSKCLENRKGAGICSCHYYLLPKVEKSKDYLC
jgi:hypothetical protein